MLAHRVSLFEDRQSRDIRPSEVVVPRLLLIVKKPLVLIESVLLLRSHTAERR